MLKLRDIMTTDIIALTPEMNLREAMEILSSRHISGTPVVDRGKVVGVFSATDLLGFISELDEPQPAVSFRQLRTPLEEVTVADVMTREVVSLGPECSVELAASIMRRGGIHRVMVMEDERLVGIVTTMNLAGAVADHRIRTRTQVFA